MINAKFIYYKNWEWNRFISVSYTHLKKELVRVVKAPDQKDESGQVTAPGEISLDLTGRKPGRGAYVCKNIDCLKAARKARRFEKTFSCQIPAQVYERMEEEIVQSE